MGLPIKTTADDATKVCTYLASKPTGATIKDAKAVIESKYLDGRKLAALRQWNFIDDSSEKLKATPLGRQLAKGDKKATESAMSQAVEGLSPYKAFIEKIHHGSENSSTSTDVATYWHEHFNDDAGETDATLNLQAVCFFHLAEGAGLGSMTIGRRGAPTRLDWHRDAISQFLGTAQPESSANNDSDEPALEALDELQEETSHAEPQGASKTIGQPLQLGQAIFLAHSKNRAPLEAVKKILGQFNIPYKVAVDEPNLGRPIGIKVRETMKACNCAILIFTADQELFDKDGNSIWRANENVSHELGACSFLYEDRIVIIKEEKVDLPSNFKEIGYISFKDGELNAKAMDIVKELLGFGILKITT